MFNLKKLKYLFVEFFILLFVSESFGLNLNLLTVLDASKGLLSPAGVTSDNLGNIFVADYLKGKVLKISADFNTVTEIVNVEKPVSVVFYGDKLFIVTDGKGGFIYDLVTEHFSGNFGVGYLDAESYKNIFKPSDITLDKTNKVIFVSDAKDNLIKPYNADTGLFIDSLGGIGGAATLDNFNGKFYNVAGIHYDSTGKLFAGDTYNNTAYLQLNFKWNPFKRAYVKSNKYSGKPKGKIQVFVHNGNTYSCSIADANAMQIGLHGDGKNDGYLFSVAGVYTDNSFLYVLDSVNKKIFVFDNPATVFNSNKDNNTTPKTTYPVSRPTNDDITDIDVDPEDKVGFIKFYGAFGFGVFENYMTQLKDITKTGDSTLVVTDMLGRIYIFYINN